MTIKLTPLSKDNWLKCIDLKLSKAQSQFVASNLETIAESKFQDHYELRAIEDKGNAVGMLAFCPEVDEPVPGQFWLFRLMVDERHQGKGYGKKAVEMCIDEMKLHGATSIRTMCKPANLVARNCYEKLGFNVIGNLDDGDLLFELKILD